MPSCEIEVKDTGRDFVVTVKEGGRSTKHQVTVSEPYYRKLTEGKVSKAECVKAAFRFLLDREPKESILGSFDLPLIGRYFPEFEMELKKYVS